MRLDALVVMIGGVLIVFGMWWLYFARDASVVLEHARAEGTRFEYVWGFGHYFIFASGAAVGAGLAVRAEYWAHPEEIPRLGSAAAVTVPIAVLMAALYLIQLRQHDPTPRAGLPFLIAIVLVLACTLSALPELLAGLVLAACWLPSCVRSHGPPPFRPDGSVTSVRARLGAPLTSTRASRTRTGRLDLELVWVAGSRSLVCGRRSVVCRPVRAGRVSRSGCLGRRLRIAKQEHPQGGGEGVPVGLRQLRHDRALRIEEIGERRIDLPSPGDVRRDQDTAPVVGVYLAAHQTAGSESVHPVGHRARRDHGLPDELAGVSR